MNCSVDMCREPIMGSMGVAWLNRLERVRATLSEVYGLDERYVYLMGFRLVVAGYIENDGPMSSLQRLTTRRVVSDGGQLKINIERECVARRVI